MPIPIRELGLFPSLGYDTLLFPGLPIRGTASQCMDPNPPSPRNSQPTCRGPSMGSWNVPPRFQRWGQWLNCVLWGPHFWLGTLYFLIWFIQPTLFINLPHSIPAGNSIYLLTPFHLPEVQQAFPFMTLLSPLDQESDLFPPDPHFPHSPTTGLETSHTAPRAGAVP